MVTYLVDTNILLRLFLRDNESQAKIVDKYFQNCKKGKLKIVVLSEVIPEIEFVLRKFYKIDKKVIVKYLSGLVNTLYIEIEKRVVWKQAINIYRTNNVDIIDSLLYAESMNRKNEILCFDKDFNKIKLFSQL